MGRLFPLRSETPARDGQPRVVGLDDEDADAVFSALSSTTAREIYAALSEQPGTPSDVAEAIDSSIQNVRYHLEKLEEAGLIEVVDTWYSSRGNEMSVYGVTDAALIVTGNRSAAERLKTALSRYLGGIAVLGGASLLVQYGFDRFADIGADGSAGGTAPADDTDDGAGAADDDSGASDDAGTHDDGSSTDDEDWSGDGTGDDPDWVEDDLGTETALDEADDDTDAADGASEPDSWSSVLDGGLESVEAALAAAPPGMLFFLGGLLVLTMVTAYWYWRAY